MKTLQESLLDDELSIVNDIHHAVEDIELYKHGAQISEIILPSVSVNKDEVKIMDLIEKHFKFDVIESEISKHEYPKQFKVSPKYKKLYNIIIQNHLYGELVEKIVKYIMAFNINEFNTMDFREYMKKCITPETVIFHDTYACIVGGKAEISFSARKFNPGAKTSLERYITILELYINFPKSKLSSE